MVSEGRDDVHSGDVEPQVVSECSDPAEVAALEQIEQRGTQARGVRAQGVASRAHQAQVVVGAPHQRQVAQPAQWLVGLCRSKAEQSRDVGAGRGLG